MNNDGPYISEGELCLTIKGMGHVPAFKNRKRIVGKMLITEPKIQRWMKSAVSSLYLQLKSLYRTSGGGTSTVPWQQLAICSLPYDDNWKAIPEISIRVRRVPKGDEGAILTLTKI